MIFNKTVCIFLIGVLVTSCSEWDFKSIEFTHIVTVGVINVGSTSAVLLGDIQNLRKSDMEETGFLLSTSQINGRIQTGYLGSKRR